MANILMIMLLLLCVDIIIVGALIDSGKIRLGYKLKYFGEHELLRGIGVAVILVVLEKILTR